MSYDTHHRIAAVCLRALVGSLLAVSTGSRAQVARVAAPACDTPAYHEFDFWIGTWESFDPQGHVQGRLRVEPVLSGCALQEFWDGTDGAVGSSFNIYDKTRRVWNETWVSNHGTLLVLEGHRSGPGMVMTGTHLGTDGRPQLHRTVWTPTPTGVHQVWDFSVDGGQTWEVMYDGLLRNVAPAR